MKQEKKHLNIFNTKRLLLFSRAAATEATKEIVLLRKHNRLPRYFVPGRTYTAHRIYIYLETKECVLKFN